MYAYLIMLLFQKHFKIFLPFSCLDNSKLAYTILVCNMRLSNLIWSKGITSKVDESNIWRCLLYKQVLVDFWPKLFYSY